MGHIHLYVITIVGDLKLLRKKIFKFFLQDILITINWREISVKFTWETYFFDEREDSFKNLPQFLTTMPRGRPRKKNKLTNAERCRRSLKKRKEENPDLYKTKSAAYSKKHYDKF